VAIEGGREKGMEGEVEEEEEVIGNEAEIEEEGGREGGGWRGGSW